MRRDKTVARILLIFSIANVVLAAPALVRQRRLVTDRGDDEPTDESNPDAPSNGPVRQNSVSYSYSSADSTSLSGSEPGSRLESLGGYSDDEDSTPNSPPSLHQDFVPRPPSGSLNQDSVPVSGGPESHDDLPSVSGGPRLQPAPYQWWLHTDERPPSQWEVGESSHTKEESHTVPKMLPPVPEAQPLQDEKNPWWHDKYLYPGNDIDETSNYGLTRWRPLGPAFQHLDNNSPSILGAPPSNDPPPNPGSSELHNIPPPPPGSSSSHYDPTPASGAAQLHNNPLLGLGNQPLHDEETPWWHDPQLYTDDIDHKPDDASNFWAGWKGFGSEAHANTPMSTVPQLGEVDEIPDYPLANWRSWDSLFRQPDDDTPSMLGSQHSDDPPPTPETSELHDIPPPPPESPSSHYDPTPASEAAQLHDIPPPPPGSPPTQDDPTPASEATQIHNDLLPGSGDQPLDDETEIEQEVDDNVRKVKGLCDLFKCW